MTQRLALIIEDHVDLAEIYKITLDMVGYTTELVTDGKVALDKLADITPDLVILDMNLPQVSGHYIYKKMRSNPAWSNIPIIISTANTIVANALADEITDVDQIVVKPVSPRKLKEIIIAIDAERDADKTQTSEAVQAVVDETPDAAPSAEANSSGEGEDLQDKEQAEDSVSNN